MNIQTIQLDYLKELMNSLFRFARYILNGKHLGLFINYHYLCDMYVAGKM